MYQDLKTGVIDGVLSDFITAAYQLDELNDNELRISHVFPKRWQYKMAIVQQRRGLQILKNECFRNRLYNPSSLAHELVMKYIRPLKVRTTYFVGSRAQLFKGWLTLTLG